MASLIIMPRSVYEVQSKITDQIRLYLDTGVHRHLGPGDTVILLGATATRVGLDREMHRDRVTFREFNVVMPESSDPVVTKSDLFKSAQQQYEWVMKHLFSGNVLYLMPGGDIVLDKPERQLSALPVDDAPKIEKLEEAITAPDLKVVKDVPEEVEEETEIDIEDDEVEVEDFTGTGDTEKLPEVTSNKKNKKNRKKSKK